MFVCCFKPTQNNVSVNVSGNVQVSFFKVNTSTVEACGRGSWGKPFKNDMLKKDQVFAQFRYILFRFVLKDKCTSTGLHDMIKFQNFLER